MPVSEENTIRQQVVFSSCFTEDNALIIKSNENKVYKVFNLNDDEKIESIKSFCDGKTEIEVYSIEQSGTKSGDYYLVKAIKVKEVSILSFDETNELHKMNSLPLVYMLAGFNVLWILFVIFSIKIGRNPRKYSKKIVRLFFKDGYVNY